MAADVEKKEEPTTAEIRSAIRALKSYRDSIYWFPKEEEAEGGIQEMMSGLESILQTAIKASRRLPSDKTILPEETVTETSEYQLLDAIPPQIYSESAELRGRRRVAHVKGIVAAAPGDIEEIWATYVQLFNLEVASHEQLQTVLNSEDGAQDAWLELADLGVEKFAQHNEQTLSRLLNFPGARSMLFAQF